VEMQERDTGALRELLRDPFSSVTMHRPLMQLRAATHFTGANLHGMLLGPHALFLTFCWPPQQRLLDEVDLSAPLKTMLLSQPFPLTQFMSGIKISLGSSLTAANICIELEEWKHGEDSRNAVWPLPAKFKLQFAPQPGPEHLSARPGLTCPPAATAEARSKITNNSFSSV